jgi:hypothetical protein
MPCPDDNQLARLLEGTLSGHERLGLEQHLDGCSACVELLAEIGRAFSNAPRALSDARTPAPAARAAAQAAWLGWVALFAAVAQGLSATKLVQLGLALRGPTAEGCELLAVWLGSAALAGLTAAVGALKHEPWAARWLRGHALLTLPSVAFTPLAMWVLRELRRAQSASAVEYRAR